MVTNTVEYFTYDRDEGGNCVADGDPPEYGLVEFSPKVGPLFDLNKMVKLCEILRSH